MNPGEFKLFPQPGEPAGACSWCGSGVIALGYACNCATKHEKLLNDALVVKRRILSQPLDLTDAEVGDKVGRSANRVYKIRKANGRNKYRNGEWFRPSPSK